MARSYGMDADKLVQIPKKSTDQSFVTDNWGYVVREWPHIRGLGREDTGLCIETARANGVPFPLIELRHGQDWTPNPGEF